MCECVCCRTSYNSIESHKCSKEPVTSSSPSRVFTKHQLIPFNVLFQRYSKTLLQHISELNRGHSSAWKTGNPKKRVLWHPKVTHGIAYIPANKNLLCGTFMWRSMWFDVILPLSFPMFFFSAKNWNFRNFPFPFFFASYFRYHGTGERK